MVERCYQREGNSSVSLPDYNLINVGAFHAKNLLLAFLFAVDLVVEDPVFSTADTYFMSREESFDDAMKKSVRFVQKKKELDFDPVESEIFKQ